MIKQLLPKVVFSIFRKKVRKNLAFFLMLSSLFLSALTNADDLQVGRYQIVHAPKVRADMMLLDTVTGRTWVHAQFSEYEGDPVIWVEEERVDDSGALDYSYRKLFEDHEMKKKDEKK